LLGILIGSAGLSAQAISEASQRFEVASIKRSSVNGERPSMQFTPAGGVRATNVTLKMLIQMAYDVREEQVSGGAGWTDSEEYSVISTATEGAPVLPEAARMELTRKRLQGLLAERFHLALKLEANPAAGYVLTVAKKGHKLTLAAEPGARQLRQTGRWQIRAERYEMSNFVRFLGGASAWDGGRPDGAGGRL
jgi:uncharacterized protein (TIGR03435 family)